MGVHVKGKLLDVSAQMYDFVLLCQNHKIAWMCKLIRVFAVRICSKTSHVMAGPIIIVLILSSSPVPDQYMYIDLPVTRIKKKKYCLQCSCAEAAQAFIVNNLFYNYICLLCKNICHILLTTQP